MSNYDSLLFVTDQLFEQVGFLFQWLIPVPVGTEFVFRHFKDFTQGIGTL